MGKISIDKVFTDQSGRMGTREWHAHILKNEKQYATCEVVTLTRIKNLKSGWVHEYIQFIVEETKSKERTRVYVERGNEKDRDWVTYGRGESGATALEDLPLPITSLSFNEMRPTLLQLAAALSTVTAWGSKYKLLGRSCFWYAFSIYELTKNSFGGQEKHWDLINMGDHGGGGHHDLWGFGVPYFFGWVWKSNATSIATQRENKSVWDIENVERRTPKEAIDKAVDQLLEQDTMKKYLIALNLGGIEADKETVEKAAAEAKKSAEELSQQQITWNEDFVAEVEVFYGKILADKDASMYIAAYNEVGHISLAERESLYAGPGAEQFAKVEKAMKAFIGGLMMVAYGLKRNTQTPSLTGPLGSHSLVDSRISL